MTEQTTREFLARLWQLQAEHGIGNAELARRLGISPSYVRRLQTRANIRRLGYAIALAAAREFPELALFLRVDLPTSQCIVPICKDEEGTQP
jgi:DNA-binding transcriptional regulator LsrR (DeoR family)